MEGFLIGLLIGLVFGVILGAFSSKWGNVVDSVTEISGGKQVIKDSPNAEINHAVQPEKEKKRIFGKIFKRNKV